MSLGCHLEREGEREREEEERDRERGRERDRDSEGEIQTDRLIKIVTLVLSLAACGQTYGPLDQC